MLLLFLTGCLVRLIPDLAANPYSIGYYVINYYIPEVTDFASHWTEISSELPLYVCFLHVIQIKTGLNSYSPLVIVPYGFRHFMLILSRSFSFDHLVISYSSRKSITILLKSIELFKCNAWPRFSSRITLQFFILMKG